MSFHQQVQKSPGAVQRLIRRADAVTPDLLSAVLGLLSMNHDNFA
jgi:hypothetical protein